MILSLVACLILLVLLTFVWPPDSPWSPWWRTNKRVAVSACKLAKITNNDVVYELGSGDGEFTLTAASEFGCRKAVGIEIDYTRFLISKIKRNITKIENAEFIRSDFKKVNLKNATVVYFYLVPAVIKRILPKLEKELRPGTRIVSYKYKFPKKEKAKIRDLYLYQI